MLCEYCGSEVIKLGGPCHIFCPKCGYHRDCSDP
ncbi:hypothetical protein HRbin06_00036 [archaeon HR06]|nr:hypothetical protein HRbin06_00036 [archaeon HR06]